ncbi:PH domain-containing protein [Jeotgalibaca ciconiae]|uniref:PH domain-containing protein n=1 Tax=Jeotgalibaca ciconiae TaxID=2496265 RepID=A0A3Q9BK98_9LACT|nr:PH domain-containing protein [Jeotgalibaca ciconiae]AZP04390.1 PH domain-containing protein [Jeotgalibaca ciconiae]
MSMFDRLTGNAGKVDNENALKVVEGLLTSTEEIVSTYKLIRDYIIFTNKRLILIDIQGIGTKKEIQSVPYRSISRFTIETAGTGDIDSEIDLYISNSQDPVVSLELGRNRDNIHAIARTLAEEILG